MFRNGDGCGSGREWERMTADWEARQERREAGAADGKSKAGRKSADQSDESMTEAGAGGITEESRRSRSSRKQWMTEPDGDWLPETESKTRALPDEGENQKRERWPQTDDRNRWASDMLGAGGTTEAEPETKARENRRSGR